MVTPTTITTRVQRGQLEVRREIQIGSAPADHARRFEREFCTHGQGAPAQYDRWSALYFPDSRPGTRPAPVA